MEEQNTEITKPEATEVQEQTADSNNNEPASKTTCWVMVLFLVIFLICGGLGYCPWWMWIIVVLWFFMSFGGLSKKWQAIIGVVVLVFGTPIFSDDDDSYSSGSSSSSSYSTGSSSYSSGSSDSGSHPQTESERRDIEANFMVLEQLKHRFEIEYQRHDYDAARRVSD